MGYGGGGDARKRVNLRAAHAALTLGPRCALPEHFERISFACRTMPRLNVDQLSRITLMLIACNGCDD
jgi:hypothetical protein